MEKDFIPAFESGRVEEIFCTGTGALVVDVAELDYKGKRFVLNKNRDRSKDIKPFLSFAERIKDDILDIQMGLVPAHPFVLEC